MIIEKCYLKTFLVGAIRPVWPCTDLFSDILNEDQNLNFWHFHFTGFVTLCSLSFKILYNWLFLTELYRSGTPLKTSKISDYLLFNLEEFKYEQTTLWTVKGTLQEFDGFVFIFPAFYSKLWIDSIAFLTFTFTDGNLHCLLAFLYIFVQYIGWSTVCVITVRDPILAHSFFRPRGFSIIKEGCKLS